MTRRTSATRSCASRSAATGTASRSRSRRWPTCPPAPASARPGRTHWRGSTRSARAPAGPGRGSSGASTGGFLKSRALPRHRATTPESLAEDACHIEIDVLGEPVGKQDQYVAAHGGICAYTFARDGTVVVDPLELSRETLAKLHHNLLLFFTGESRSA